MSAFQQKIKPLMMPLAILAGVLFHAHIGQLAFLTPYLIFAMLFLTFCKLDPRKLRFSRVMYLLLGLQLGLPPLVFIAVRFLNESVAQAVFITMICPVATAAPVVTGLLGGKIEKVAAFSVISNLGAALTLPFLFPWVNPAGNEISFAAEFMAIASRVCPMIVLPLAGALLLRLLWPKAHRAVAGAAPASFYLWSVSLIIVVGTSVSFIISEPPECWPVMAVMAMATALVCALLFALGKRAGTREGDAVSAGQSLGQKNTILAIWLSLTYLNPISSVGPAAYVIWQNIFNSWQMYRFLNQKDKGEPNSAQPR